MNAHKKNKMRHIPEKNRLSRKSPSAITHQRFSQPPLLCFRRKQGGTGNYIISCAVKNHQGITLVEALVTVVIFAFILGICYTLLISGSDSWETNSARVELQQELRKAMDWITQDLRQAGSVSITGGPVDPVDGTPYPSITFRKAADVDGGNLVWDANTTRYFLGGTGGTQLLRQVGAQAASVIAQNIQSVQFSRQASTANVVNVSLQTQKTTLRRKMLTEKAPSLTLKIYLRN